MRKVLLCFRLLLPLFVLPAFAADSPELTEEELASGDWELVGIEILSIDTPVETSEGLKGALLGILGPYDPPVVVYEYQNQNNQYMSYLREVVPDYPFLAACAVLLLLLYGLIRLGGVLCRK